MSKASDVEGKKVYLKNGGLFKSAKVVNTVKRITINNESAKFSYLFYEDDSIVATEDCCVFEEGEFTQTDKMTLEFLSKFEYAGLRYASVLRNGGFQQMADYDDKPEYDTVTIHYCPSCGNAEGEGHKSRCQIALIVNLLRYKKENSK